MSVDVPDALYRRLQVRAAELGVTIRDLVVRGIERELVEEPDSTTAVSTEGCDEQRNSCVDEQGWPVLKRSEDDRTVITNEFVNRLRRGEGV